MDQKIIKIQRPLISVVLPSYNRRETLKKVLISLEKQSMPDDLYEVVVSDDGSNDGTAEFLTSYSLESKKTFKYIVSLQNNGPARARNLALREAVGEIIIIIGDDIVVEHDFVAKHYQWHQRHDAIEEAVLGQVVWPDSIQPSCFMRWLYTGGRQYFFNYEDLRSGQQVECRNFYTCNISIKRQLLFRTDLFDESFPYASHEDLELGNRLCQQGMKLFYDSGILGYHHHFLGIQSTVRRVYLMGHSANIYWQKVQDNSCFIKRITRNFIILLASIPGVYKFLQVLLTYDENQQNHSIRWTLALTMSYWLGVADAKRGRKLRKFTVKS